MVSVLSYLGYMMQTASCVLGDSWQVLYSAKGRRRISTRFSLYCTSLAVSVRRGRGWVWYRTLGIATTGCPQCLHPQSPSGAGPGHSMHNAASGLSCFLCSSYEQDFAFTLALNVPLNTQPGNTTPVGQRWPHKLIPCGFLHISASLNSVSVGTALSTQ